MRDEEILETRSFHYCLDRVCLRKARSKTGDYLHYIFSGLQEEEEEEEAGWSRAINDWPKVSFSVTQR